MKRREFLGRAGSTLAGTALALSGCAGFRLFAQEDEADERYRFERADAERVAELVEREGRASGGGIDAKEIEFEVQDRFEKGVKRVYAARSAYYPSHEGGNRFLAVFMTKYQDHKGLVESKDYRDVDIDGVVNEATLFTGGEKLLSPDLDVIVGVSTTTVYTPNFGTIRVTGIEVQEGEQTKNENVRAISEGDKDEFRLSYGRLLRTFLQEYQQHKEERI